jgi:hypothetical protein
LSRSPSSSLDLSLTRFCVVGVLLICLKIACSPATYVSAYVPCVRPLIAIGAVFEKLMVELLVEEREAKKELEKAVAQLESRM